MKNRHLISILILLVGLSFSSCKLGRFVVYNFADIKDYKKFPARTLEKGPSTFYFDSTETGKAPKKITFDGTEYTFDAFLKKNKTVAFLIIRNDTIQYEKYFDGYSQSSIVPSFSMAKSITSMLIGCAIDDGLIKSVAEPVTNYIPELKENGFEKVTIENLLQMTSGLKFNESYVNPFGQAASIYYGTNLRKEIFKWKIETQPGTEFDYVSGDPQILCLILERALQGKTITEYFEEKIWSKLGTEYDASWSIDSKKDGLEKTFCCVNARARDFAKLGRLYLNDGNWNGEQLVPETWVAQSTKIDTSNGSAWYYQYQWWLPTMRGDYLAQGILGQYIYVNPAKNLIVVRLGKKEGMADWFSILASLGKMY